MRSSGWLLLVAFAVLLLVAGTCLGVVYARKQKPIRRHYFCNELLILGKDHAGVDFMLEASLSRAQMPLIGNFDHYYDISLLYGATNASDYHEERRPAIDVAPLGALTSYHRTPNPDLSAREEIRFGVRVGETSAEVEIRDLNGDFLIKNSPEYTKYMSVGTATVTVGGETFEADALTTTAYSEDFAPFVFFEGHETLKSDTHILTAWDDDHNFYHVDVSHVEQPTAGYMPHTWVLTKSRAAGECRRAFAVTADFHGGQDGPVSWKMTVPDLGGLTLSAEEISRKAERIGEGIAGGVVRTADGATHKLHAAFAHHRYGG